MAKEKQKGVATLHPDYERALPIWQRCIDAAEGEQAIHNGGQKYLPILEKETPTAYADRRNRTPFFNATWRTIAGLRGMLFRKSPAIDSPDALAAMFEDIDMAGTPLDMFAQEVAEEVLTVGRCGILVDHPPMPVNEDGTPITRAQAESAGLRPMLLKYPATAIINWKAARVNNVMQCVLIVLRESAAVPDPGDPYAHKTVEQWRELTLTERGYRQRVFQKNERGEDVQIGSDVFPQIAGKPMPMIPFIFINADDLSAEIETPPLLDLVNMNIHHYQVSADWEHGCHFSGLPTPVISGYQPDESAGPLYIGSRAIIALPSPEASAAYMEVKGDFKALQVNLAEKKAEMAVLGARMLENQKTAVEAAETLRQRQSGENSALAAMAQILSMAFSRALTMMAAWAGIAAQVRYEINRDFTATGLTAQELTALVQAWQSGAISGQTLHANLQAGEIVDADTSYEEEQERIASAGPRGDAGIPE